MRNISGLSGGGACVRLGPGRLVAAVSPMSRVFGGRGLPERQASLRGVRHGHQVFRLRFACTDCAHFDAEGKRCSNGFPNEAHREPELGERLELLFCKAFELY